VSGVLVGSWVYDVGCWLLVVVSRHWLSKLYVHEFGFRSDDSTFSDPCHIEIIS